jgi:chemotaxis family two-component system response regulator PixH
MNPPRVLIVDDSPSICLLTSTALRQVGYEVDTALNGREGFAKIRIFRPHCLILDVLLPDTSGYTLCRHLRQNAPTQKLPLILISSKSAPLDVNYGLRQGANGYLPKPFTAEALLQKVWEVVPETLRSSMRLALPAPQPQQTSPALLKLIPRRILSQDAMQTSNPFASTPAVKDKQARLLFAEIDGKKTVASLATITGLEIEEVVKTLRVLLNAHNIQIYNVAGQPVEEVL